MGPGVLDYRDQFPGGSNSFKRQTPLHHTPTDLPHPFVPYCKSPGIFQTGVVNLEVINHAVCTRERVRDKALECKKKRCSHPSRTIRGAVRSVLSIVSSQWEHSSCANIPYEQTLCVALSCFFLGECDSGCIVNNT